MLLAIMGLRWDTGAYEVNFSKNVDFEIFVEYERKFSSESNGICFIITFEVFNVYFKFYRMLYMNMFSTFFYVFCIFLKTRFLRLQNG